MTNFRMVLKELMATMTICSLVSFATAVDFHKHEGHYPPIPYSFSYGIKDDYNGVHFGQTERSDGKRTLGSYSVQLPDGRLQTVKYIADHRLGFYAEVTYKGIAKYPSKGGSPITFPPQYH